MDLEWREGSRQGGIVLGEEGRVNRESGAHGAQRTLMNVLAD